MKVPVLSGSVLMFGRNQSTPSENWKYSIAFLTVALFILVWASSSGSSANRAPSTSSSSKPSASPTGSGVCNCRWCLEDHVQPIYLHNGKQVPSTLAPCENDQCSPWPPPSIRQTDCTSGLASSPWAPSVAHRTQCQMPAWSCASGCVLSGCINSVGVISCYSWRCSCILPCTFHNVSMSTHVNFYNVVQS